MSAVYIAARFSQRPECNALAHALKAQGHTITSRWVKPDADHVLPTGLSAQAEDSERRRFAMEDCADVRACDWVVSLQGEPRSGGRGGRHVEFGYGLALGKRMISIGPRETVFHHMDEVTQFASVDEFLAWSATVTTPSQRLDAATVEQAAISLIVDLCGAGASQSSTNVRVVEDHLRQFARTLAAPAPSCAPGEVEALVEASKRCREIAMHQTLAARIPECGEFGKIAQELDAALSPQGLDAKEEVEREGFSWSFNADTRDIEFGASPVFKVYEASDFPCLEDGERAEADKWYDAQAQTAVLMLNSLLNTDNDEPVATPSQRLDAATVERCAQIVEASTTVRDSPQTIAAALRALATEPHQHGGKGA